MYNYFNQNYLTAYYVSDYQEVLNTPVSTNGEASLFVDLTSMIMYSKKMINGQTYIQPYKIEAINNIGSPNNGSKEADTERLNYTSIINELKSIKDEINAIKGGSINESE